MLPRPWLRHSVAACQLWTLRAHWCPTGLPSHPSVHLVGLPACLARLTGPRYGLPTGARQTRPMKPEVPGCARAMGSSGSFLSGVAWILDPLGIVVSILLDACGVPSATRAQRWQHLATGFPGGARRVSRSPVGRVHLLLLAGQGEKKPGQCCPPRARLEVGVCPNVCFVRVEMMTSGF